MINTEFTHPSSQQTCAVTCLEAKCRRTKVSPHKTHTTTLLKGELGGTEFGGNIPTYFHRQFARRQTLGMMAKRRKPVCACVSARSRVCVCVWKIERKQENEFHFFFYFLIYLHLLIYFLTNMKKCLICKWDRWALSLNWFSRPARVKAGGSNRYASLVRNSTRVLRVWDSVRKCADTDQHGARGVCYCRLQESEYATYLFQKNLKNKKTKK